MSATQIFSIINALVWHGIKKFGKTYHCRYTRTSSIIVKRCFIRKCFTFLTKLIDILTLTFYSLAHRKKQKRKSRGLQRIVKPIWRGVAAKPTTQIRQRINITLKTCVNTTHKRDSGDVSN